MLLSHCENHSWGKHVVRGMCCPYLAVGPYVFITMWWLFPMNQKKKLCGGKWILFYPCFLWCQDSAIFGDISNLSPVKPLKDAPVVSGFLELSSPPSVFTSPHPNTLHRTTYLKRFDCLEFYFWTVFYRLKNTDFEMGFKSSDNVCFLQAAMLSVI